MSFIDSCFNNWSLGGGTIWKGYGNFSKWTIPGEVCHEGWALMFIEWLQFLFSLFPECGRNVVRQLPAPTAMSPLAFVRPFPL